MRATIDFRDSLYQKSESLAASRKITVEQFIVEAVSKELQANLTHGKSATHRVRHEALPVIRSMRAGTLDLSNFGFDTLLT
uniref:Uncharacterized protein n=1 Tax=Solibacter usitatus (strain Ellin6076) TaxID=234267 RepID=Q01QH7_SOLUE